MIRMPRRSVTRFFIPLIDVLILLFCTFLLLPLIPGRGEGTAPETAASADERIRQLQRELALAREAARETPRELREELERLRRDKIDVLQERLAIRVLHIDPDNGQLYYLDPQRVQIDSRARAVELVERERQALGADRRELYFLILYPRDPTSRFPHRGQREQYDRWFEGIAHGFDIPGTGRREGGS